MRKLKDVIIGLAIGDAMGVPLEFKKREHLQAKLITEMKELRNEIEHPKNIRTTMFSKVNGGSVIPQIIYENKSYDLLEIANEALQCMCIYFCIIIQAAFLNSKYVVAFTDESRKIIYGSENTING